MKRVQCLAARTVVRNLGKFCPKTSQPGSLSGEMQSKRRGWMHTVKIATGETGIEYGDPFCFIQGVAQANMSESCSELL